MKELLFLKHQDRYLGYFVFGIIVLWKSFEQTINTEYKYIALLGSLLTLFPILNFLSKNRFDRFPFIELVCLFYFIEFFFCYFFINENKFPRITFNPLEALSYSLIGVVCFLAGNQIIKYLGFKSHIEFKHNPKNTLKIYVCIILLLTINLIFPYLLEFINLSQIITPLQLFAIPYFLLLKKTKTNTPLTILLSLIYIIIFTAKILISSLLAPLLIHGLFAIFCYLTFNKRLSQIQFILLIPLIALGFLLSEVKSSYRSKLNDFENGNTIEKISTYSELIFNHIENNDINPQLEEAEYRLSTMERFANGFIYLSAVTEKTPTFIPYLNGVSYHLFVFKIIPRILWPGKPKENAGQEIAHRYHLLDDDDTSTSFNIPILAEFFVNFGLIGIVIGMLILGTICGYINATLNISSADYELNFYDTSAKFSLLGLLIFQESNFSLLFGNLIMFILLYKAGAILNSKI